MTHAERKARRDASINATINYLLNAAGTTKINTLFNKFGAPVFGENEQYYLRVVIDALKNDSRFKMEKMRKLGTFVCKAEEELVLPKTKKAIEAARPKRKYTRRNTKPAAQRKVTMKSLFDADLDFIGVPVEIAVDEETWKKCCTVPKFIRSQFNDTVEVWRKDIDHKPSQYLQITESSKYLFTAAL